MIIEANHVGEFFVGVIVRGDITPTSLGYDSDMFYLDPLDAFIARDRYVAHCSTTGHSNYKLYKMTQDGPVEVNDSKDGSIC